MNKKKLMLLGGLKYLLPVINQAHKLGIYVITVDYIPNNIAHKYSDEYHNVSIIDKESVLKLAKELKIDGIMSFAVDPGVVTASYVAEKMGLPFQGSYEAVKILQNKALFRKFLKENKFNVPNAKGYTQFEEALKDADNYNWPIMVKPVDSAGSKGVSCVYSLATLEDAVNYALSESPSKKFIIEDFLEAEGDVSGNNCFSINGELVFCSFSKQLFDKDAFNPYVPSANTWPSSMPLWAQNELQSEIKRLIKLLGLVTGIYHVETRLCKNGRTYIMELSPRGAGCRVVELLELATEAPLIENSIRAALGMDLVPMYSPNYINHIAVGFLYSNDEGVFDSILLSDDIKPFVIEEDLWIRNGDKVDKFTGSNKMIGTLVLKFPNKETQIEAINKYKSWYKIILK